MRILVVGEDRSWAIERSFVAALRRQGVNADLFDWWRAGAPARRRSLARRPIWPLMARRANRLLMEAADGYDVIFVLKGLLLDVATVRELRRPGRAVVCFNPDNPWKPVPSNYSTISMAAMAEWDAYLIWSHFLVSRLYSAGCRRVDVLLFAWDPSSYPYIEIEESDEACEISFVGNWSPHRQTWIARLADLPITVYGPAWQSAVKRLGRTAVRAEARVPYQEAYARALATPKVSLNFLDPHNCPGTNQRTFEIPGVGGVTCSTWTEDIDALFSQGAVATFRTESDLRQTISDLLDDPSRRRNIRERSHELVKSHTFDARAVQLLGLFEQLG